MKTGKIIIIILAVFTAFGAYAFDWNATHIFNEHWPPHAKFHNAQTMVLGTLLGLLTLWLLWKQQTRLAIVVVLLYWIAQVAAFLFPGTALTDPEFAHSAQAPAQLIVCGVIFVLSGIAYKFVK